jgi:hypothetical protein
MNIGYFSPNVQMTNATFRPFMQSLTDLTATRTLRDFMLMLAENVQDFLPGLLFKRIFCNHHSW